MVTVSSGGGPILAAVEVKNANRINFYNCKFVHLGGSGLKYSGAAQNSEIIGNEFCDISANGLYLGGVDNTDRAPIDEAHAVSHMTVSNNYLHRIAVDYCSGTAISAGFPQYTDICNNEIFDIPYTGIHIGWG